MASARRTLVALIGMALIGTALSAAGIPAATGPADCATDTLAAVLHLPNVTVDSATPVTSGTFTPTGQPTITGLPVFCDVDLTHTDAAGNPISVEVWLPRNWNGRFQGVGGSGFFCGIIFNALTPTAPGLATGIRAGYATASTDCGHPFPDASFALNPDDTLNRPLITDYASAGVHDMTVDGKALTAAFYGHAARYSYFYGCSTGGRQGMDEAQRFPSDYDGIVSGAPAINFTTMVPAEIWPALVMNASGDALPVCKEDAFTGAVVAACDGLDGVVDGVISDPAACRWDPHSLVGTRTPCGMITATDADVIQKIWQGPETTRGTRLWFGLEPGAPLTSLAGTVTANGATAIAPFSVAVDWLGTFVQRNPGWDWHTLTFGQFDTLFAQSVREFSPTIATNDPDLSAFGRDGGKVLIWHGLADPQIFPQGTIAYYQAAQRVTGGTSGFARLFLAPGASHCVSGAGPEPDDPLAAVVAWVEHGKAPTELPATLTDPATGAVLRTRTLCAFPLVSRYIGHGDPNNATNYTCARTF
ncbi:MAG TPA: tannase/feruloyl esterase family alpha/beta hydrolase [Pseudonocardiaceae bacterium]|jgi:feruloyl esterase